MGVKVSEDSQSSTRAGFLLGTFAYLWWGMVPLYFSALKARNVSAEEILSHRILWSLPVMLIITAITGNWKALGEVFRSRKLLLLMLLSSGLLAINWLLYIYATMLEKVVEGSLGYFMLPLVNAFLGTMFLGEKLRKAHYFALSLIAFGMCIPFVFAGAFTWFAITLPVTFGLYGFVRKAIPVDSLSGLTVETLLMLPGAILGLSWFAYQGTLHVGSDWKLNGLLVFSGIVTVAPLLTYIMSIRRLPLIAVSFLQFLSPTTQMLIALWVLDEKPPSYVWKASACVWVAVAIFMIDAALHYRKTRRDELAKRAADAVTSPSPGSSASP
jgi:chloramphenicol-sensitive protein RarD